MNKHKKINLLSICFFITAIVLMIIGLLLLSSEISYIDSNKIKLTWDSGFQLIQQLELQKYSKINHIIGMLDIFTNRWNNYSNIINLRCGIVFTVLLTPIFSFISFIGFGYNYYTLYKLHKDKN